MKHAASRRDVIRMKKMEADGLSIEKISKRLNISEKVVSAFLKGKKPPAAPKAEKANNAKPAPKEKAVPKPKPKAEDGAETEGQE